MKDGCQNGGRKIIRDGKKDNRMDAVETSPILVYGYTDNFTYLSLYIHSIKLKDCGGWCSLKILHYLYGLRLTS